MLISVQKVFDNSCAKRHNYSTIFVKKMLPDKYFFGYAVFFSIVIIIGKSIQLANETGTGLFSSGLLNLKPMSYFFESMMAFW